MEPAVDADRFEALYGEYAGRVLGYCLRRSPADTAEDAMVETFAVAWRRRDAIPEEPLPWLYGVARRVLANQRRAERRQRAVVQRVAGEIPVASEAPATDLAPVIAALERLRPADRELLMLTAWEGLTPAQAAQVLGTTAVACRVRLFRARRRLERLLADEVGPPSPVRTETKEAQP